MAARVPDRAVPAPRELPENGRAAMAKADLRKPDDASRRLVGAALTRAKELRGWTLDQLAAEVQRDPRQVARWLDGSERAPMDLLWAVESFRHPLIQGFSEMASADVEVTIRLRRPTCSASR